MNCLLDIDIIHFDDNVLTISLTIIAALVGLSYPLILQIIQHLDEKYDSIVITSSFKEEPNYQWYQVSLIISVVLLLYYPIAPHIGNTCWIVAHSASLLLFTSCIISLIALYYTANMIWVYSGPKQLCKHFLNNLIDPDRNLIYDKNYYEKFNDLYRYSIRKGNAELYLTCNDILGICVNRCNQDLNNRVSSPAIDEAIDRIFSTVNETTRLCLYEKICYPSLSHPEITLANIFPLICTTETVNQKTLNVIWKNLKQFIQNGNDEFIENYWSFADSKANTLRSDCCINREKNERENNNLKKFQLMHHVLCSYLLYRQKYNLLNSLLQFRSTSLDNSPLLPHSLYEIVCQLSDLKNEKYTPFFLELNYPFNNPGMGINEDELINNWLLKYYIVVLLKLQPNQLDTLGCISSRTCIISIIDKLVNAAHSLSQAEMDELDIREDSKEPVINKLKNFNIDAITE